VVRGHLWGDRLVREGAVAEPLELLPGDTPPRFSPCVARRWASGDLVFDSLEFEADAEEAARRALEEGGSLGEVKGAPATLRAAFGYAVAAEASRRLGIALSPVEARAHVGELAERGAPAAEALLRRLAEARAREARERTEQQRRDEAARVAQAAREERERRLEAARRSGRNAAEDAAARAEAACDAAGARLRDSRLLANGQRLEVTYTFMGERFISLLDAQTLQVLDAGICLAGEDRLVTFESLFSVIREAIETDVLVVTRHA